MRPPDKERRGDLEGQEARRDTRILFHGVLSSPFDLQGVKPVVDVFERALEQSTGRNILYMESPSATHEDVERSKMVVENHGLVDPIVGNIFRAHGADARTQDDLDKLRQTIDRVGTGAITIGLVPPTMAREYFFHRELQRVREDHPFDVEYESHQPEIVSEVSELEGEIIHLTAVSVGLWLKGEVEQLIENQKRMHQAGHQIGTLRAPDVISDLTSLAEDLLQTEEKGALFIPFSLANTPMVYAVRRNFWENAAIELEVTSAGFEKSPETRIREGLQNGIPIADEVYAQHFLEIAMSAAVKSHVMNRRRLTAYMENYETLEQAISATASTFSLAEIEELSKTQRHLLDVLRVHPLSAPLLPYISTLLI